MRYIATLALLLLPATALAQGAPKPPAPALVCQTCHAWTKGVNKIGPSLNGVVGRKIASYPAYNYSAAMKAYGAKTGAWTPAVLEVYLAAPMQVVKGTKMAYPGQKDAAKRKQIIAFLASLK